MEVHIIFLTRNNDELKSYERDEVKKDLQSNYKIIFITIKMISLRKEHLYRIHSSQNKLFEFPLYLSFTIKRI